MNSNTAFLRNSRALRLVTFVIFSRYERVEGALVRPNWLKMPPAVKQIAFGEGGFSFWFSLCSELIMKVAAVHF